MTPEAPYISALVAARDLAPEGSTAQETLDYLIADAAGDVDPQEFIDEAATRCWRCGSETDPATGGCERCEVVRSVSEGV